MKVMLASIEGDAYFDLIEELGEVLIPELEVVRATTPAEMEERIGDVEVLYGFPGAAVMAKAERLRWIQSPGAGVDWVARVPGLTENDGIVVTNTRGAHAPSIAEHVFGLLLALTRGIPQAETWKQEKYWGRNESYRTLREIKGSTMGIIGFGAIGRAIARRALAFEMSVIALDAHPVAAGPELDEVLTADRLPELLAGSDVVVVTVPYSAETHHLLDAERLRMMRNDAYLIAISRGGIVEEAALVEALASGQLAGAGLDVTEVEPLPADSPLWDVPNLIITPHVAGASGPKERRCVEIFRENLTRYAAGDELVNVVDKRRGY